MPYKNLNNRYFTIAQVLFLGALSTASPCSESAYHLAPGVNIGEKLVGIMNTSNMAFVSPAPRLAPTDCLVGIAGETAIRLFIYTKDMHMNDYSKITALYSCLSVENEDRDGGESNSIQNQDGICQGYFHRS